MFNAISIVFATAISIVLVICFKRVLKYLKNPKSGWWKLLSKLNWRKLLFEMYLISFAFYVSIKKLGLFRVKILELKENLLWFEVSIFLIIPAAFVVFIILIAPPIIKKLHLCSELYYSSETNRYLKLLLWFLVNKFYLLLVLTNILTGLTSKIF